MIAVVGQVGAVRGKDGDVAGLAGSIAAAAAGRGARVELVTKLGDDPAGDAVLFALTRAGVGHAAILRDPARPTPHEPPGLDLAPGDLELALRYLTDATVIVLVDPDPALLPAAVDGAGYAAAALVIVAPPDALPPEAAAAGATVLAMPARDREGAFTALVAEYAVGLDVGRDPGAAWAAATRRVGAEPA